ncbi:translocation/assembly module TamB domain-containing protein [Flexithrix dorotheae]|uniref:translocation/assembly module TamB domain-containing protein n=1 Tax=Flexithrix dorotheae TaxID=70993 RepID=UPI000368306C|nr:translocation/assembly module TamB domain-containing protein [Flexithrix dorotheae]
MDKLTEKLPNWLKKLFRVFLWIVGAVISLLLLLVILIRIPYIQNYLTQTATNYLEETLKTKVEVGGIKLNFPKAVALEGIYIEDLQKDTLLYAGEIAVNLDFYALFNSRAQVDYFSVEQLTSHIYRIENDTNFNYQFVIDAFSSEDTTTVEDTAQSSFDVGIDDIILSKINFTYSDYLEATDFDFHLNELEIEFEETSLLENTFLVDQISINGIKSSLVLGEKSTGNQPLEEEKTESPSIEDESALPHLGLTELNLQDINFRFQEKTAGQNLLLNLNELAFLPGKIDLNKQELNLGKLNLKNSLVQFDQAMLPVQDSSQLQIAESDISLDSTASASPISLDFGWVVKMNELKLENNTIKYNDHNVTPVNKGFDPSHIEFKNFSLEFRHLLADREKVEFILENFSVMEKSGFGINNIATQFSINHQKLALQNLELLTFNSEFHANLKATYPDLKSLTAQPEDILLDFEIDQTKLFFKDLIYFAPDLDSVPTIGGNLEKNIALDIKGTGKISDFELEKFNFYTFDETKFISHGEVKGLPDINALRFEYYIDSLHSTQKDLLAIINDTSITNPLNLPSFINLQASASGKPDSLEAETRFHSNFGLIRSITSFEMDTTRNTDFLDFNLDLEDFKFGEFLEDETIGPVSLNAEVIGKNITTEKPNIKLEASIIQFLYNQYNYRDLDILANYFGDSLNAEITSKNQPLDFSFTTGLSMQEKDTALYLDIDLRNIDFFALNLQQAETSIKGKINSEVHLRDSTFMDGMLKASELVIVSNKRKYPIETTDLDFTLKPGKSDINLISDFMTVDLNASFHLLEFGEVAEAAYSRFLNPSDSLEEMLNEKNFDFEVQILEEDFITDILVPDLQKIQIGDIKGAYLGNQNKLDVNIDIPKVNYADIEVDSFLVALETSQDILDFNVGFSQLTIDSFQVAYPEIGGSVGNGKLALGFKMKDEKKKYKYQIEGDLEVLEKEYRFKFLPEKFILNYNPWTVNEQNAIYISDEGLRTEYVEISHENAAINFAVEEEITNLNLKNIDLSDLFQLIKTTKYNTQLITGMLDLDLNLNQTSDSSSYFSVDSKITDFALLEADLGTLSLSADDKENHNIAIDMALKNDKNDLEIAGIYQSIEGIFDFDVDINQLSLKTLEPLTLGNLKEMNGLITGNLEAQGTAQKPFVTGMLNFREATLNPTMINTLFKMDNEKIVLDEQGIEFQNFTLKDREDNKLSVDGYLITENYTDFDFDLNINAKDFQVINSTKEDNDEFYGKFVMGTDLDITGNMDLPVVKGNISIDEGTDMTYVLPPEEFDMISDEDIVEFRNVSEAGDTTFNYNFNPTISANDTIIPTFTGIELNTVIDIDKEAQFGVVIDPKSGDYAKVVGGGHLNFLMNKSGNMTLTGRYEITRGEYLLSFYGLVKKEFQIAEGSFISWTGDVLDAEANISCLYEVKTSSLELIANEIGNDESQQNIYRQKLPFTVEIDINGELMEPNIRFGIGLEKEYRVKYPTVANKLNMLDDPNYESKRNQQVFALLVLGGFISEVPVASNQSTTSMATSAARNSVNGMLADQLNKLSGKYIQGVDLSFGLDTYDDYSGGQAQTKTELDVKVSKEFMNDRLEIEVGGSFDLEGEENPNEKQSSGIDADVAIIYKLTEDGRYRLKGFRENSYDTFDGELVNMGIAFIMVKDFREWGKEEKQSKREKKIENLIKKLGLKEEENELKNESAASSTQK